MTLENYNYRTDPLFLRNQFDEKGESKYKIPNIPKAEFTDNDFEGLLLLGFDRAKADDTKYNDRIIHFFLYDYKFENIWKNPNKYIEKLKPYKAVLSPDFSMYREMNPTIQLYNTFRNRFCGAYLADKGIKVIPTVSWGDENTFDFCFLGVPKGSTVAVSTYMVSEHGNHKDQKEFFLKGYNEMLRRIQPEKIICYNTPFPEMKGNIVFVDYELSSWKYQEKDYKPSKYVKYITGELPLPKDCDIIIKKGYVTSDYEEKGMGSAYGGEWQPKKEEDKRFLGEPGEIKTTIMKNGERYDTKIGPDGRAIAERHYSDHNKSHIHTTPHDHTINWEHPKFGFPNFEKPHTNYYGNIPEFKNYKGEQHMNNKNNMYINNSDYNFESISDFEDCMIRGGEVLFKWEDKTYSITHTAKEISIAESYKQETEKLYLTVDEVLSFMLGDTSLRDVITQVEVICRTI